jgi:hypothetical protein
MFGILTDNSAKILGAITRRPNSASMLLMKKSLTSYKIGKEEKDSLSCVFSLIAFRRESNDKV